MSFPTNVRVSIFSEEIELDKFDYLSDVSDTIDFLTEEAKTYKRKERHNVLEFAQCLMNAYENHIGKKVYTPVI